MGCLMKSIIKLLMFVVCSIAITGCSPNTNKPSKSELKVALNNAIPQYTEIIDFKIEAQVNIGNEVDQIWATRYKAKAKITVPLYSHRKYPIDNATINKNIHPIVSTQKGTKVALFGKVTSTLYQGKWQHLPRIEGDPFHTLGRLKNNFENANQIIVGTWNLKKIGRIELSNEVTIFKSNGNYTDIIGDYTPYQRKWKVTSEGLSLADYDSDKWRDFKIIYLNDSNLIFVTNSAPDLDHLIYYSRTR